MYGSEKVNLFTTGTTTTVVSYVYTTVVIVYIHLSNHIKQLNILDQV